MSLAPLDKQFRHEYEPVVIEDVYYRRNKSFRLFEQSYQSSESVQTPTSELHQTYTTDVFKNLIIDRQGERPQQCRNYHLLVFVHGFQACAYDMRTLKNYVSLRLPRALTLCSTANENRTEGSIE